MCFMAWMFGNTIQIFSIFMMFNLVSAPLSAIASSGEGAGRCVGRDWVDERHASYAYCAWACPEQGHCLSYTVGSWGKGAGVDEGHVERGWGLGDGHATCNKRSCEWGVSVRHEGLHGAPTLDGHRSIASHEEGGLYRGCSTEAAGLACTWRARTRHGQHGARQTHCLCAATLTPAPLLI